MSTNLNIHGIDAVLQAAEWCGKHLTDSEWNVQVSPNNWVNGTYVLSIDNPELLTMALLKFTQ